MLSLSASDTYHLKGMNGHRGKGALEISWIQQPETFHFGLIGSRGQIHS